MFFRAIAFFKKFRGEIIISSASLLLSVIAAIIIAIFFRARDLYLIGFYCFGFLVVILMVALLFNQKRLFNKRFRSIDQLLIDHFGFVSKDNQFFRRREHYANEKKGLAKVLVRQVLPNILEKIYKDNRNLVKVNLIIDSGTTLTPIFPELINWGVPIKKGLELNIYTNSMSGIDEIHKLESGENLQIPSINLIGGRPLSKYRATTGEATEAFLQTLWDEQENSNHGIITLSILTANWFLAGNGLDRISICARGLGHLEFKTNVSEHSDYKILVSPLGKLLRLNDVNELNELLKGYEDDVYRSHLISDSQKNTTFLLTTRRDHHSLSPFCQLTIPLDHIERINSAWNYTFCNESPIYDPPGTTFEEAFINETPHKYIRDNFEAAYGFTPRK